MDESTVNKITQIVERIGKSKDKVIPILQAVQNEYHYLPKEILQKICELTDIQPSQITGVSTFYNQFRHVPAGKHVIKVCVGTACHVKGALNVYDAFKRHFDLNGDQDTDKEGLFTMEQVSCLGCCTLAPVVQIDEVTYGHVRQNDVSEIVGDFLTVKGCQTVVQKSWTKSLIPQGEIRLGLGSCCVASGSEDLRKALINALFVTGIQAKVKQVGCVGMCHQVPLLEVIPQNKPSVFYAKVKPDNVKEILLKHFNPPTFIDKIKNLLQQSLETVYADNQNLKPQKCFLDMKEKPVEDFLNKQIHIATEYKGFFSPVDIEEYKQYEGFKAIEKCLKNYKPKEVIEIIKESGIRGRGGAGFPTGKKWEAVFNEKSTIKYLICNGDEGDPGAFMDRMLLESFPYRIIEGMLIGAYAIGATKAFFYIRAEYPLAVKRIRDALKECEKLGLIGENILGTGFSLSFEVFEGAGAFVCGEETALIASMEGERGMPRIRPPYPAQRGLLDQPTLINNVETIASIPWIVRNGAQAYSKIGTPTSKGTKVFALAGKIARGGLIEVPMGISIREIIEEIGGGIAGNKKFKAVQIGGPSGGCIPSYLAHTPVDFHFLNEIGAMMGSGGLVVLDETDCVVDIAKYFLSFTQNQSCGKCIFCRVGTKHMLNILGKITSGKATLDDLTELEELSHKIKKGSLCGLGKTAPNPVITSLKYFKDEYLAHIAGKCPSKKCKDLISYSIKESCIGCTKCAQQCPVNAIAFHPYELHKIDNEKCIKCDICKQICPVDAVIIK
jgi:NADH:ubiquinone oxidoreductase subunit F (NADH-binding)/NADH:ubiquinone oxidoreductase subunit E/NAD-dependent dihydropyrimidine dehydrogenase PreA subunit